MVTSESPGISETMIFGVFSHYFTTMTYKTWPLLTGDLIHSLQNHGDQDWDVFTACCRDEHDNAYDAATCMQCFDNNGTFIEGEKAGITSKSIAHREKLAMEFSK